MPDSLLDRIRKAWSIFRYGDPEIYYNTDLGIGSGYRPDLVSMNFRSGSDVVASIYTRIGIDVAAINIKHARVDEDENFKEVIQSGLNDCLNVEANIDQTGRAFIQDVVMSLCDEGSVAIVPVETTVRPHSAGAYDVLSMRTGRILQWYPEHVQVEVYNQRTGIKEALILPKKLVAIVENPLYAVMNQPNSTLQRLITKIQLLDVIDNQSGSGKLDLIIQLPYVIKTDARRQQADIRRDDLEAQLVDSKYGIAYVDGTEKIIQLNRPAENNLMGQIEYLTSMLWSQLGLTKEVFEGTADEAALVNYYNRTVEPILAAITGSMNRVFLTKTARSQGQRIIGVRDPFRLVPVEQLAEVADKFTRNEILTSNEVRSIVGMRPSEDPKADELRNKNLNQTPEEAAASESLPPEESTD